MRLVSRGGKLLINANGHFRSCCCPSVTCCLYPAPVTSGAELPLSVIANGTEIFLNPPNLDDEYSYGATPNIGIPIEPYIVVASGLWRLNSGPELLCLIGEYNNSGTTTPSGDVVEDNFEDTYTITGINAPGGGMQSIVVNRVSLCRWEGADDCGNPVILQYFDGGITKPTWTVSGSSYGSDCSDSATANATKDDPQDKPDGTYTHNGTDSINWNVAP